MQLEAEIAALPTHELNVSQLKKWDIHVQRMVLDGKPDETPVFFSPHPNVLRPSDDFPNEPRSDLDCDDHCFTRPVDRTYQIQVTLGTYSDDYVIDREEDRWWSSKE